MRVIYSLRGWVVQAPIQFSSSTIQVVTQSPPGSLVVGTRGFPKIAHSLLIIKLLRLCVCIEPKSHLHPASKHCSWSCPKLELRYLNTIAFLRRTSQNVAPIPAFSTDSPFPHDPFHVGTSCSCLWQTLLAILSGHRSSIPSVIPTKLHFPGATPAQHQKLDSKGHTGWCIPDLDTTPAINPPTTSPFYHSVKLLDYNEVFCLFHMNCYEAKFSCSFMLRALLLT